MSIRSPAEWYLFMLLSMLPNFPERGKRECGSSSTSPAHHPWQPRHRTFDASFSDDLDQHTLTPPPIKLSVKYLFPRPEVQLPIRNGDHHLPPHELPLDVRIAVVFTGVVVPIGGLVRREPFESVVESTLLLHALSIRARGEEKDSDDEDEVDAPRSGKRANKPVDTLSK